MIIRFFLIAAAACALTACASSQQPPKPPASADAVARGGQIAAAQCASCHAIDAESKSAHPLAPPLRALSAHFEGGENLSFALGTHARFSDMPPLRLSQQELSDLSAYVNEVRAAQPR